MEFVIDIQHLHEERRQKYFGYDFLYSTHCIYLAEDRDQWRNLKNTAMNLQVPWTEGKSLTSWATISFSRNRWASHCGKNINFGLLGCSAVYTCWHRPPFRRNILSPSLVLKCDSVFLRNAGMYCPRELSKYLESSVSKWWCAHV
jgi:hypothetical protein